MTEVHGINIETKLFLVISSVVIGVFLFWLLCINTVSPGYVGVVNNLLGELALSVKPTTSIISSTYSRIITIDPYDTNSVVVNVIAKAP